MPVGDNSYNVKLEFVAHDVKNPTSPTVVSLNEWNDLPYVGLVELQKLLIKVLEGTNEWGQHVVQAKGLNKLPGAE